MERMERVNATDLVVNYVRTAIQEGEFKVGDRLPREASIAEQLGVGRSSLREGMKILNAYGVIESRQGEGTFIVDNRAQNFFQFMGFCPTRENLEYFMELRRVIEIGNIATIYDKMTPEQLQELENLANIFDTPNLPENDYIAADKEFHQYMIGLTQNPMMVQINNMLAEMRTDLLQHLFSHKEIVEDARVAHHRIVAALKSRDLGKCIAAVGDHLDTTIERIPISYT